MKDLDLSNDSLSQTGTQTHHEEKPRKRRFGPIALLFKLVRLSLYLVVTVSLVITGLTFLYRTHNPISTYMLVDRLSGGQPVQRWADLNNISQNLMRAILLSEDGRYCAHDGIDWLAVEKVLDEIDAGKKARGASTITMQLARNLFLWPQRSYIRKSLEVPIAYLLNLILGKRRIFEIYLNVAQFGPHLYGADAATRRYFRKSARSLTLLQAALLATTLPNPAARNPGNPKSRHSRLAEMLQKRMKRDKIDLYCLSER